TAVAFGMEDATAPARVLLECAKTMPKLEFKAGVVEGTYYDQKGIQVIATIPSRDVLISKLLGSLQSPITNFARVLKQIAENAEKTA
ncbi:MAG TPA: 50S ribosomal protein L10, partial [Clostridiales bacterium]|nr:50S ribosomal protein L10 [Clostridiales bacterium]